VRFQTATSAQIAYSSINSHRICQFHGLDEEGSEPIANERNFITAELVSGSREELYWEKIPPKIREQCLERQLPPDDPHETQSRQQTDSKKNRDVDTTFQKETWFPFGCLVFVRNVHPGTNKTTLRKFFGQAFPGDEGGNCIDYVDFQKGLDNVSRQFLANS
jgi:xRRM domain